MPGWPGWLACLAWLGWLGWIDWNDCLNSHTLDALEEVGGFAGELSDRNAAGLPSETIQTTIPIRNNQTQE